MDIFSKKPSNQDNVTQNSVSNDTSTQPVVTQPVQPQVNQPVVKKEKHNKAFSFVSILFLLTLLGAGFLAYFWYNQTAEVESLNRELTQAKAEQETLKKQVILLKKDSSSTSVPDAVITPTLSETDQIKQAVESYVLSQPVFAKSTIEVNTVNYKAGSTLVLVPYSSQNPQSGLGCIVKKAGKTWTVIDCSQGLPDQTILTKFGIPANFQTAQ